MSKTHTPGPWKVHKWPKGETGPTHTILGRNREEIANMEEWGGKYLGTFPKEQRANARLIAAAPEMLEALKALFDNCAMIHKYDGENCNQKEADKAIMAGKAAIAKAEGTR